MSTPAEYFDYTKALQMDLRAKENGLNTAIIALRREYNEAQANPLAKLPTGLSLAIECVMAQVPAK